MINPPPPSSGPTTTIAGISLQQLIVASSIGAVVGVAIGETLKSAARAWTRQSRPRR